MAKKVTSGVKIGFIEKLKKIASNVAFIYGTIATIIGLVTTIIIYVNKTTSQEARIKSLEESNKHLDSEVATLKGALDGVNNAVKIFLTNSPDLLNYKIDELNRKVDGCVSCATEKSTIENSPNTFANRVPGQR